MGRRHQVDYPQVPQSHRLNEESNARYENRFSWMENNPNVEQRQHAHDTQMQTDLNRTVTHCTNDTTNPLNAISSHELLSKQSEAQMSQEAYNASSVQDISRQSEHQPPPPSQAYLSDIKRSEKSMQSLPIAPDSNPLSPSFPGRTSKQERRNTNMGVLSPPNTDFVATSYTSVSQPVRGGSWQYGLCSCADPATCVTGIFCPCILYGKVQYRLSLKSDRKDGTNMLGYKAVNGSCMAWSILCGINGILAGIQRTRVRRSYEMDQGSGNCFGDCVEGCCCCCCVLAQNEKEMKHREEGTRWAGMSQREGYVPPGGMTFSRPPR